MEISNLVLVGDSIRLSYQPHVAAALPGCRVWGPAENCESSRFLLENLDRLVIDRLVGPSTVHLNAGAHDLRRWPDGGYRVVVDIDEYGANLERIVVCLQSAEDVRQIILATTTPVIDDLHMDGRWGRRRNEDVLEYNERLRAVATSHELVVNDLCGVVESCPFDAISADGIHLTERGAEHVGQAVASFLRPLC